MKRFFILTLFLLQILICAQLNAKLVAILPQQQSQFLDFSRPTHILVIGNAHGMGTLFLESAITRGYRYAELYPDHQIVIVGNREKKNASDIETAKNFGLLVLEDYTDIKEFTNSRFMSFILKFSAIQSLDFFSHTSMNDGPNLEDSNYRFNAKTPRLAKLKQKLLPNAYIFLHGCNGGFIVAPELSQFLKIPVAGALTSTDFQQIYRDKQWYTNSVGQYPDDGRWLNINSVSFSNPIPCDKGACMRMHPDNHAYEGLWGSFGSGLGFYKFFCNYEFSEQNSESNCYKTMALSLLAWPSIRNQKNNNSEDDFKNVLIDFICPTDKYRSAYKKCERGISEALVNHNNIFSPFNSNPLECNLNSCAAEPTCEYDQHGDPQVGTCTVIAPANTEPKSMLEEVKLYWNGFSLLRN